MISGDHWRFMVEWFGGDGDEMIVVMVDMVGRMWECSGDECIGFR